MYNGSTAPEDVKEKSIFLEKIFTDYFESQNLPYTLIDFSKTGGSDHFPFLHRGIPAGSIAAGAGGLKTSQQRTDSGGSAGAAFDSCYHQACDTPENINQKGLREMVAAASYAAAYAVGRVWI